MTPFRLAVVAEYYPRPSDPALGIWAHRQAAGVHALGADVRALALERPLPPLRALRRLDRRLLGEWLGRIRHPPADASFDGVPIRYVRFVSPPRPVSYATWGRWAACAPGPHMRTTALQRPRCI